MSRKSTLEVSFSEKMETYARENLTDAQQIHVAKRKYLLSQEVGILKAYKEGYTPGQIAEVATKEFLASGVQKSFLGKNKEGEEIEIETRVWPIDIKGLFEPVV